MGKLNKMILLAIISIIIVLPLVGIRRFDQKDVDYINKYEKRNPYSINDFITQEKINRTAIEGYFNERMLFRKEIIKQYINLNFKIGVCSGPYNYVVVGKDGWIFKKDILSIYNRTLSQKSYRTENLKDDIAAVDDILKRSDTHMIYMISPYKKDIYPEYLPDFYTSSNDTIINEANQIDNIIDMVDVLLEKKKEYGQDLFYKTDGHWTEVGAYFGYSEFVDKLNEFGCTYNKIEMSGYNVVDEQRILDYGFLLGTDEKEKSFVDIDLSDMNKIEPTYLTDKKIWSGFQVYQNEDALNDASILIVGNSYFDDPGKPYVDSPKQLFTNTFSKVYYCHNENFYYDYNESTYLQQIIEHFDIDAVLMQDLSLLNKFEFMDKEFSYDRFKADFYLEPEERIVAEMCNQIEFKNGNLKIQPTKGQCVLYFEECGLKEGLNDGKLVFDNPVDINVEIEFMDENDKVFNSKTLIFSDQSCVEFDITLDQNVEKMRVYISGDKEEYLIDEFYIANSDSEKLD